MVSVACPRKSDDLQAGFLGRRGGGDDNNTYESGRGIRRERGASERDVEDHKKSPKPASHRGPGMAKSKSGSIKFDVYESYNKADSPKPSTADVELTGPLVIHH